MFGSADIGFGRLITMMQDSDRPGHGPAGEGCCLSSAYGCCPDNIRPAGDPAANMTVDDDCGCDTAEFGCCEDKKTARRSAEEGDGGCGCKHRWG